MPFTLYGYSSHHSFRTHDSWSLSFDFFEAQIWNRTRFYPVQMTLFHPKGDSLSCANSLAAAYDWRMNLTSMNWTKSIDDDTYFVRFSSPTLQVPSIFPKVDRCCEQRLDLFSVNKDLLHFTVEDVTIGSLTRPANWLAKIDQSWYGVAPGMPGMPGTASFAVDLKLKVNLEALPRELLNVTVRLGFKPQFSPFNSAFLPKSGSLNVTFVVNNAGVSESEFLNSLVIWVMVFVILVSLVAALAYVYREDWLPSTFVTPRTLRPGASIEMRGRS